MKKILEDGDIVRTQLFEVGQDWEVPIPGFFILAPLRKIKSISEMTDEESAEFMYLLRLVRGGMKEVLEIKDVYLFQNEDTSHGFHFWILPRHDWMEKFGLKWMILLGPSKKDVSMKLYLSPGACSMASHIALIELGLKHSIEFVDLRAQPHVLKDGGAPYASVNPKGAVPALKLDSGEILTENAAILQYLADQKPEAGLIPKLGTMARYHAMEWLNFVGSDVHKSFAPLWNPSLPEASRPLILQNLDRRLKNVDQHLANNTYLLGESFSVADAYMWVLTSWMPHLKLDVSVYPNLKKHFDRVSARPSIGHVLKAEGLA